MALLEWDEKMSVGVKAMDDDHKALVGLLNEMSEALDSEQERKVLGAVLERMIQYTKDHLAREERLLAEHGYPDCTEHHKGHDLMIATALQAQASFRVGRSEMLSDGMLQFLKNWLESHIMGTDKEYGPFLNSKGIY